MQAPTTATEQALSASLSLLPVGLLVLDPRGRVALAEGGALADAGLDVRRLTGRRLSDNSGCPPWLAQAAERALGGREAEAIGATERGVRFEVAFRPVLSAKGELAWVVGSLHELTRVAAAAERRRDALLRAEFEQVADVAEAVFWQADPGTMQVRHVSKAGERLLGFPLEAWLEPDFWLHRLHPDDAAKTIESCARDVENGRGHQIEYRMIAADGRVVWVRDYVAVVLENGRPVRLRGMMLDVTELKRSRDQLERSHALLEATLEATADGVLAVDNDGRFQSWNRVFRQMWGLDIDPRNRLVTDDSFASVMPMLADPEAFLAVIHRQRTHPEQESIDEVRLRDGRVIERACRPQRLGERAVGRVWTFRDVTERRRSEEARALLLEQERRAREAAEAESRRATFLAEASRRLASSLDVETTLETVARVAIPTFADAAAAFLYEDGRFRQLAAAHLDPAIERTLIELFERYPPDPDLDAGMGRVAHTGEPFLFTHVPDALLQKLARAPEHLALLRALQMQSYLCVPMMGTGGIVGVVAFATSQRTFAMEDLVLAEELGRRCAAALGQARMFRQTQQAIRLRDEFLALASHELRTPLTPLRLLLSSLERRLGPASGDLLRILHQAQASVDRMTTLVGELVDVTLHDAGTLTLHPQTFALDALVRQQVAELQAESPRHSFVVDAEPVQLSGDRARLTQVVANVLDNAVKYSPEGGTIRVSLSVSGEEALLSVADPGIGIPRDQQARLFDRYARASSAPTTRFGGLGLGLFMSRNIVERHRGRIWVESEEGQGAVFHVALPLGRAPPG